MAAGSTYTPIATTTASGSTGTITFSSISGSYTDLVVVLGFTGSAGDMDVRINSDTGSNYSYTRLFGDGTSASSSRSSNVSIMSATLAGISNSNTILHFMNYSNTTTYKTVLERQNNTPIGYVGSLVGLWRSTSAINRLDFILQGGGNLPSGCTFTLYGISAA